MNRLTLRTLAASTALLAAVSVFGQPKSATPASTAPAPKQQKLVHIATLNTAEANREFQNNVQILQGQKKAVLELNAAVEKEKDTKKKAELKTQLDAALAKLNENNDKMNKAYGFSLARNYTMEVVTSNIYMAVTEEEAAQIEKEQKAIAAKAEADKKKGKK